MSIRNTNVPTELIRGVVKSGKHVERRMVNVMHVMRLRQKTTKRFVKIVDGIGFMIRFPAASHIMIRNAAELNGVRPDMAAEHGKLCNKTVIFIFTHVPEMLIAKMNMVRARGAYRKWILLKT